MSDLPAEPPCHPFTLHGFCLVHRAMRNDLAQLRALLERARAGEGVDLDVVRAWYSFSWAMAEGHHKGEDSAVFPEVAARSARFRASTEQIGAEHAELDIQVERLNRSLGRDLEGAALDEAILHAEELYRFLDQHLVVEERSFIDAIRAHFSEPEQLALQGRIRRSLPLRMIGLILPWMFEAASAAEQRRLMEQLPLPARLLYHILWLPYYRMLTVPFQFTAQIAASGGNGQAHTPS